MDKLCINLNVKYSKDAVVKTVYRCCGSVAQGYYLNKGFFPVTENFLNNPNSVGIPKTKFKKMAGFWEGVKQYKQNTIPPKDKYYFFIAKELNLDKWDQACNDKKNELARYWEKIKIEFCKYISSSVSILKNKKITLDVFVVPFGTLCSFTCPKNLENENLTCTIYLRIDFAKTQLIEGIFSALLATFLDSKFSWFERESIIDFLCLNASSYLNTSLKPIETIPLARKINFSKHHFTNSRNFHHDNSLSFPSIFSITQNDNVQLFGKRLKLKYTSTERILLKELIQSPDNTITLEKISSIIWPKSSNYKFSLWAINKRIQRLRDKLQLEGLPRSALVTVKGEGYFLNNNG